MQRGAGLPVAMTPFVGRREDLALLEPLLRRDDVRLVTLCGPAGVGKTRLAVAVGQQLADAGAPVRFVSLAEVRDPGLLGAALLIALDVADAGAGAPMARVAEVLGDEPGVLVLDNLEQLLPAAGAVVELLELSPRLTVLATSRHPLRLRAERVVPVLPFALPDGDRLESEATDFLLSRLESLDPTEPWADRLAAISAIARRVDGLPLALELAAARARVLSLESISEGLSRSLDTLGRAGADVPDRQQTMRDAVAWSCALLPPRSAVVFRRLGACVGGCSAAMVAALVDDLGLTDTELLDCLDDVVSHSLMSRTPAGRFRMLEVVREHAAEELEESGELDATRNRHAEHLVHVLEERTDRLVGHEQGATLDELQEDAGNLAHAVRFALEQADSDLALRLCLGMRFLWYVRGPLVEGQAFFAAALALPGAPVELRVRALVESAALARHRGELSAARSLAEQGLADAPATGRPTLVASALLQLGFVAHLTGDYEAAQGLLEECLALREGAHDPLGTARVLHHLGLVAVHGRGDLEAGQDLHARALLLFRELGNGRHVATTLIALADLHRRKDDGAAARQLMQEALSLAVDLRDQPLQSYALFTAAALAADTGRASTAVRLVGGAESIARTCGAPPWPVVAAGTQTWLPLVTARYGAPRVAQLRAAGASTVLAELVRLAVAEEPGGTQPLTPREREVSDLVAGGLTNREIAAQLFVSERTVEGHVAKVLAKLGLASRAQLAVWVVESRPVPG